MLPLAYLSVLLEPVIDGAVRCFTDVEVNNMYNREVVRAAAVKELEKLVTILDELYVPNEQQW